MPPTARAVTEVTQQGTAKENPECNRDSPTQASVLGQKGGSHAPLEFRRRW